MVTNHRISLWSGPRNVSTALMYSFAQRKDTSVLDEPLYGHYLKFTGVEHPGYREVLDSMETDGEKVIEDLLTHDFKRPVLFVKNMAHHLAGLDWSFLHQMDHFILIRNPREMLPSMIKQYPHPILRDTGLDKQWQLVEWLLKNNRVPLIVDSKDLLQDPSAMLAEICRYLEIEFEPSMLKWKPGPRPEDGVWAKHWYHNVHRSKGFNSYSPKNKQVRPDLLPLLEECNGYYQLLRKHALGV